MKRAVNKWLARTAGVLLAAAVTAGAVGCTGGADSRMAADPGGARTEAALRQQWSTDEDPLWQDQDLVTEGEAPQAGEGQTEPYLGGAVLTLLAPTDGGQNLSCAIQTTKGSVIMVDGGTPNDAQHLIETIQSMGGRVSAWLITHPHSDHIGALTEILKMDPIPIEIDDIYYTFLDTDYYRQGEHQGRMENLEDLLAAFENVDPGKLHTPLEPGKQIQVDEITVNVLNEPFACPQNTFNNSSVGYRLDVNGKRILFLGDMGWQAGENLMQVCSPEDLKADVVQMSHHGQDGVEYDVYQTIAPEVCLWPTPDWLWYNERDGVKEAGSYKTPIVKGWMRSLGVKRNLCAKDGDQVLR